MICLLVLGIFIVVNADVAPPAHQPKIEIPGASSKGTKFSANEFYGAGGTKINYPLPDCYTNESGFMCCNAELEEEMHKSYEDLRNRAEWISCNVQAITNNVQKRAEARFGLPFEVITGISDFASKAHFYHNYICKLEREGRIILAYATPKNGGDLTKLESAGIPGVGDKIEGAAPAGDTSAGASIGGASVGAGGVGVGPVGPQGGNSGASAGVGGFGGASVGAGGVGAGPVGPQGGNSGANAGVGGSGDSDDFGRALAATRGEQVGSAGGVNAGVGVSSQGGQTGTEDSVNAAAAPRGEAQAGSAAGANAGVGVSSQGGKLAAPYKLTRISALQK